MYGGIFEDFHRYMGTNIPQKQVFDIKVDINKDPEGYEKLRQMAVDFFKHFVEYNNELSNAKLTFKQFDKVLRVFNEKCETILHPSLEICQLSSISNASNSFRRVFTIHELFDFFRLLYRMAESHFYAEMDVNPRLAHLETIK